MGIALSTAAPSGPTPHRTLDRSHSCRHQLSRRRWSSEEERGINWSSVLSLSSQSDLDPINNNSFAESWTPSSQELTDVDLSQHSFDDINWKLTPVSADDVLKAFPNDENLFQCSA